MRALAGCRTGALGGQLFVCTVCQREHFVAHVLANRVRFATCCARPHLGAVHILDHAGRSNNDAAKGGWHLHGAIAAESNGSTARPNHSGKRGASVPLRSSGKRQPMGGRQFTGQGLNLHDQFWGKKTGATRPEPSPLEGRGMKPRRVLRSCTPNQAFLPPAPRRGES